jgi:hypothetical protein
MNVDELRRALTELAGEPPAATPAFERLSRRVRRSRRRRLAVGVTVVAVLVLASVVGVRSLGSDGQVPRVATVAPTTSVTTATPTTVAIPAGVQRALDAWKSFPVDASPRPLIVFEPVNAPDGGFPDNDTKLAWESGQFAVSTALPTSPSTSGGYPLVNGQVAIGRIAGEATPGPTATKPLDVTAVTLGSAQFPTDRGMRQLPAWIVTFAGIANPAQVLAVSQPAVFQPPAPVAGGGAGSATLVGDRTLQIQVFGKAAGDGPCQANYEVHVYESEQAVAVVTHEIPKPPSATTTAPVVCADVGYTQILTTTIARPLGNRVVINGTTRAPLAVTSASGASG